MICPGIPFYSNDVCSFPHLLITVFTVLLQTTLYVDLNSSLFAAFNGSLKDEANVYCAANADSCFGESTIDQPYEPDTDNPTLGICPNADIAGK